MNFMCEAKCVVLKECYSICMKLGYTFIFDKGDIFYIDFFDTFLFFVLAKSQFLRTFL